MEENIDWSFVAFVAVMVCIVGGLWAAVCSFASIPGDVGQLGGVAIGAVSVQMFIG